MKTSAWIWQSFSWRIPRKRISRHQRQSPNISIDMLYHHQCQGQMSVWRKCTIKWTLLVKITAISTRNLNKFLHACFYLYCIFYFHSFFVELFFIFYFQSFFVELFFTFYFQRTPVKSTCSADGFLLKDIFYFHYHYYQSCFNCLPWTVK